MNKTKDFHVQQPNFLKTDDYPGFRMMLLFLVTAGQHSQTKPEASNAIRKSSSRDEDCWTAFEMSHSVTASCPVLSRNSNIMSNVWTCVSVEYSEMCLLQRFLQNKSFNFITAKSYPSLVTETWIIHIQAGKNSLSESKPFFTYAPMTNTIFLYQTKSLVWSSSLGPAPHMWCTLRRC